MPDKTFTIKSIENVLSEEDRITLIDALKVISNKVCWKPGKDIAHLKKRRRMKHLSGILADYEQVIYDIVKNAQNTVYLYDFMETQYYAVRGFAANNEWLVIFGRGGLMETAFPPQNIDEYIERRSFIFLGRIKEVLQWTKKAKI
jgi:hypothetical protein